MAKHESREERDVLEAREKVETDFGVLRQALDREVRWMPRGEGWTLPLVGLACGLALALGRKRR